jgi:Leucine-rich repeat (LRR) protein
MPKAQEYIEKNYSDREKRKKITVLNLESKDLEGVLDLSDFTNLEKLNCSRNELDDINLSQCSRLTDLNCCYNLLENLDFLKRLPNPKKLAFLDLNECGVLLSLEEIEEILESFNLERRGEKIDFFSKNKNILEIAELRSEFLKLETNTKRLQKEVAQK